jgi:exoribonuclease-2
MNVLYEEDGGFKAGTVLSDQGGAFQVESASGKRAKVKATHVLVEFKDPAPAPLLREAQALAEGMDLDFLWECAPQEEFDFASLATEYFGHAPSAVERTALLMRLHGAPMYFYRKGRGRYRAAPPLALQAALASVEKKKQLAILQATYVEELKAHQLPEALRARVAELLFKPDRNSVEFKALEEASSALGTTPPRLMLACGGLKSPRDLHLGRFLFTHFPQGTGFPAVVLPGREVDLPLAATSAFSIDDHTTTEIDDALSVEEIANGWRIGVHIAAPGLSITRGDALDELARQRYSTVYMPGDKITMLPETVVAAHTLREGEICPVVSLYLEVAAADFAILGSSSCLERILIAHNLRLNTLEDRVTKEALAHGGGDYPCHKQIGVLWGFAQRLHAQRQAARVAAGLKPEGANRADYNFYIGEDEHIEIKARRRGSPLDKIVAELMIITNSTWGKLLADRGVPGIYRVQQGFGLAGRVRMVAHAAPHQGLGVAQYAWCTSPLRRYVDLVNQWQLIACLRNEAPAFAPKDAELFAVISGFDAAYAAYAEFQATMERYWCLRWVEQEQLRVTEALVVREDWVHLAEIPLQFRAPGLPALARGTRIEVELIKTDLVDLHLECRVLAIIEEVDDPSLADPALAEALEDGSQSESDPAP